MSKHLPGLRRSNATAAIGTDSDIIEEAARLARLSASRPGVAKRYLFVWLLVQAHEEATTPGAILDRLIRSQPSRNDQYGLLRRLRAKMAADV